MQEALRELLEAIYEPIFHDCSYGFRRGRSAHDALRRVNRMLFRGEVSWILEIDVESFFDSIDRKMLLEMLQERVVDGSLKRLVGKCLHVGIFDGDEYSEPEEGTVQGAVPSPAPARALAGKPAGATLQGGAKGCYSANCGTLKVVYACAARWPGRIYWSVPTCPLRRP